MHDTPASHASSLDIFASSDDFTRSSPAARSPFTRPSDDLHTHPRPLKGEDGAFGGPTSPRLRGSSHDPSPDDPARLIHHLTIAIRSAWPSDWERKFMASCIRASRGKRQWRPSAKQVAVMRRLVDRQLQELREDDEAIITPGAAT